MSPFEQYQHDLTHNGFSPDAAQAEAMQALESLYQQLIAPSPNVGIMARLFKKTPPSAIRGLYLWGGVGRGKTYMVDTFFEALPFEQKLRLHFHRLMQQVHEKLKGLSGQSNPMELVAEDFSKRARVLCVDEFFVSDITDAMLMAELLKGLMSRGVVLLATSNIEPNGLYKNGLQRARFLPAIDLLNIHCDVMNVDSGIDYRLRVLTAAPCTYVPNDAKADKAMIERFHQLSPEAGRSDQAVEVLGRSIQSRWLADDVVMFEFAELCQSARSQLDYIELACCFHSLLLTNVIQMSDTENDAARRFIALIDELYDRRVKLLVSAQTLLADLYTGKQLEFEFKRCLSRLQEMQSEEFLALAHRP
ncbi:cell division protein ZapE [Echinimonas agarilytica]|uniref:Cell division protein ZapE n=1 Tax=Echinimonas agarilytica TaxID=1215918 RepID=A0AA41W5A7_9GAMM|nr:cell division protein ZapE [Echinimonas agarilytica]MCM2678628.1 cell division protein ZapE [Echinimonas agarilytica]